MENPYLPPQSDTSIQATPLTLEFDGKSLIVPRNFTFPAMCIKTGVLTDLGPQRVRNMAWYPPLTFLLFFIGGPILFLLIGMFFKKTGVVRFHISREIAQKRRKRLLRNWALFALSIVLFVVAGMIDDGRLGIAGLVVSVLCLIFSVVESQFLTTVKIDKNRIWLRGIPEAIARVLVASNGMLR
jgi:hypothetical protein